MKEGDRVRVAPGVKTGGWGIGTICCVQHNRDGSPWRYHVQWDGFKSWHLSFELIVVGELTSR